MNPSSPEVLNNMGLILFNLGQNQKAIECFMGALKENHEFPRALNNLGNALRREDD
jgi:tetratricopeptide (TPR) repeat protein